MFDHLLESSRLDDFNKWSNIGFDKEIGILEIKICTSSGALPRNEANPSIGNSRQKREMTLVQAEIRIGGERRS